MYANNKFLMSSTRIPPHSDPVANNSRPKHVYVGAGWDTKPFEAEWAEGTTIHCVDGQPHSEFGIKTYYEDGKNRFSRPYFVGKVLDAYTEAGFVCSVEDKAELENTGLLTEDCTGERRVVRFDHVSRDIIIYYHFNSGLPEHTKRIAQMIGTYQGIVCSGHWPNKSMLCDAFDIPDRSLTFRGYAETCFGPDDDFDDMEGTVTGRLSYDCSYRRKFKHFVFYDVNEEEHWFDMWEEFLVWIQHNPDLAYN